MTDRTSYRQSHAAPGYGERYDANYSSGYYAALHREIEAPTLAGVFQRLSRDRRSLLDFACGTGRITRLATPFFERVVGIDVSEAMLERARGHGGAAFLCQDLTKAPLSERFAVVTAFRFFLNAEEDLRVQVLDAIRPHLVQDGRLVCNVHMNKHSVMGVVYRLIAGVTGTVKHKTLSRAEFERTLATAGFEVEQIFWYGVIPRPGRLFGRFLDRWLGPMERTLARLGLNGRFAQCFIVVARLSSERAARE